MIEPPEAFAQRFFHCSPKPDSACRGGQHVAGCVTGKLIAALAQRDAAVREECASLMEARANWLKKEYMNGGNFIHLSTREDEARYVARKIRELIGKEPPHAT